MQGKLHVITGATGLIGSHLAEKLLQSNQRVRALVRTTSDTSFLRPLGVEVVPVVLQDRGAVKAALEGAEVVYHCAARVGDWGPWQLFQEEIVDVARNLLEACKGSVGRVVFFSSLTVYGRPARMGHRQITEDEPLGQRLGFWDYYRRAKIAAERLAWDSGIEVTILRPGWTYGPRDRNSLPRLVKGLYAGRIRLIGSGDNLLNLVYAGDVADGAILAGSHPRAVGQAYHLCSEGELTQRAFITAVSDALGMPPVRRRLPFRLAYLGALFSEVVGKAIRLRRPPHITRYAVSLVGRPTRFSIAKAREHLGWEPRVSAKEGVCHTLAWLKDYSNLSITESATNLPCRLNQTRVASS